MIQSYICYQIQITSDTFSTFINVLYNKLFSLIHTYIISILMKQYDLTSIPYPYPSNPCLLGRCSFNIYCIIVYHSENRTIYMIFQFTFPQSTVVGQIIPEVKLTVKFCYQLSLCGAWLDPYRLSVVIR